MAGAVVLDAGPLILLAGRKPIAIEWLDEAIARETSLVCAGVTYAEVWRGHSQRPREGREAFELNNVLKIVSPVPTDEAIARYAGELLATADLGGRKHTVDAIVVATASVQSARVLTGDPDDIRRLTAPAGVVVDRLPEATSKAKKQRRGRKGQRRRRQ